MTRQSSDALLERLLKLHPKLIDLSLGRMHRLLASLDHPEDKLPPAVHVTGTNGKGSTLAFLRAILQHAGYAVQVYSSPHLVHFHERIRLADGLISERLLAETLARCEAANAEQPITFFEITTAAAFIAFSEHPADIVLLENGLGGRLDATNVVARPALTGITPISMDHQNFLGDTLAKIAFEKAGIMKPDVACVLAPQEAEANAVLEAHAAKVGAKLIRWSNAEVGDLPSPNLLGAHQKINAAHAATLARNLVGFKISEDDIHAGLQRAEWPARMQRLSRGPLTDIFPDDWEVWLDGGHNPAAGEATAAHISQTRDARPLYLITAMIESKDPHGYFAPLAPHVTAARCVSIPGEKAAFDPDDLANIATSAGVQARASSGLLDAARGLATQNGPARVLICGSLYFAGYVLRDHS